MLKNEVIKVGFCVAYDWELLKKAVPRVYHYSDVIYLSLDKNRRSWTGLPFDFNDHAFYEWVNSIDTDNKIKIFEENFFQSQLSSIENDNRQRTLMSEQMGKGGWHIQIDSDEYFFDFKAFRDYLLSINPNPTGYERPLNIECNWISLIKKTDRGYIYVSNKANEYETMPFATNKPEYLNARRNSHFNHLSPFFVLHETWARGEDELRRKLNSWGHDNDFLSKESYFKVWSSLDEFNYMYIRNFHPLNPNTWQKLDYVPHLDIDKVIDWLVHNNCINVTNSYLRTRNSRIIQGLKQRLDR